MFNTIAEGVKKYKKELRRCDKWRNSRKKFYARNPHSMGGWSDEDNLELRFFWIYVLRAMEEVLGLTQEEIDKIYAECGVKR